MDLSAKDFVPPIVAKIARKTVLRSDPDVLFDGDDAMFTRIVSSAKVYGEYGMGASTRWVLRNTEAQVRAVDTSEVWVEEVRRSYANDERFTGSWVDVGAVGDWGRPTGYIKRSAFPNYLSAIWSGSDKPDVVLVDGRFRVACFLHSLLSANSGAQLIFDDYIDRPHYHVVEEILPRLEVCGRQARFVVPDRFDRSVVEALRDGFRYVMD